MMIYGGIYLPTICENSPATATLPPVMPGVNGIILLLYMAHTKIKN
jgi:hypothetical protein